MATTSTGGCACGAIRYEISADPVMSANCYCRDCQKSTAGAMAPVIVVPKSAFRLIKRELKYHAVVGDSGNEVGRGFCAFCGAPITTRLTAMPDVMVIKAASLERACALQANDEHLYVERPAMGTGRPRVAKLRQDAGLKRAKPSESALGSPTSARAPARIAALRKCDSFRSVLS